MRNARLLRGVATGGIAAIAVIAGLVPSRAHAGSTITVVADGIDNPRGLAVAPSGTLYVAAVGVGGDQACMPSPEGGTSCVGLSGQLLAIAQGNVSTVASGFVSVADQGTGMAATGMDGVTLRDGSPYVIMTSAGPRIPPHTATGPLLGAARHQLGNVLRVNGGGNTAKVADIDDFEFTFNPIDDVDSNPYALAAAPDGSLVAADAAGNTVLRVQRGGKVSLIAAIADINPDPNNRIQAVPTGVAVDAAGNIYVSELASFVPGAASILKITTDGQVSTVASGLWALTSIALDPNSGALYATEFARGDLVRVNPDGSVDHLVDGELVTPGGVAVASDGSVYVSNFSIFPGSGPGPHGQIVRVVP